MTDSRDRPVLVLGAGINGAAVARELVLNRVPVCLVDLADIATGATAKSSRLIHGGVRYLEYADFGLVSESLEERERQLQLAPQFVKPLRLHIPIRRRMGGLLHSAFRFLGLTRFAGARAVASRLSPSTERGLLTVRFGLWLYDRIARSSLLPGHTVHRIGTAKAPDVDPETFRWVCSYSDAQMLYPERFVVALLDDARAIAAEHDVDFQVLTYHEAQFENGGVTLKPVGPLGPAPDETRQRLRPPCIVNTTGAWGDLTLKRLGVSEAKLFGGTKGSHIVSRHRGLRQAIGDDGVYAETQDGRLVFILPFDESTLVGTTDLRFEGSPGSVVATEEEVQYLVEMVNLVFGDLEFTATDVCAHYCGVRPLPHVPSGSTGSISRGHSIHQGRARDVTLFTLVGGKLTTWRPVGEELADRVLETLHIDRAEHTRDRPIPGAESYPQDIDKWIASAASETGHTQQAVRFLFVRMGTRVRELLRRCDPETTALADLPIAASVVREMIATEWVTTLCDLVERRLALVFCQRLSLKTLRALHTCLVESGLSTPERAEAEVNSCREILHSHYGIDLQSDD